MKFVGISGGIGSGKSTVLAALAARGAVAIDVDAISREMQEPGGALFVQIVARWGAGVLSVDGRLDRSALSRIVFADRLQLAELTGMAAPLTESEILRLASAHLDEADAIVVAESALYIDPMYGMSGLVVVDVPVEVAVARLVAMRGMDKADAMARIASQQPRELRLEHAGFVVSNAGPPELLDEQIESLIEWIRSQPDAVPTLM